MSALTPDFSIPWVREEAEHGTFVLFAWGADAIHLLAPPGAPIQPDERYRERACWRYAVWEQNVELGPPAISVDPPSLVSELGSAEVVEMLPSKFHDFVRAEMARQLCRAATFGEPPAGRASFDRHAQLAGRTRAWVSSELAAAFPGEDWYALDPWEFHIPRTVEELLRRMPPGEEAGSVQLVTRWSKAWRKLSKISLRAEYEAVVGLAYALRWVGGEEGRSGRWSRRLNRRVLDERYELPDTSSR